MKSYAGKFNLGVFKNNKLSHYVCVEGLCIVSRFSNIPFVAFKALCFCLIDEINRYEQMT